MGNKKGTTNDILVKVDQNNLMYIDPNSVVDKDGQVLPREVQPENLVTYVNLEADLIPRTTLITGNDTNSLSSIAKGTFNLMRNAEGRDFDTKWTDTYTEYDQKFTKDKDGNKVPKDEFYQYDSTAQSFGIESITISIQGMNLIPQVNIKFIDVRGKTLFESPENSPYKAFFHLPWPIFYLTVKGYYGKAIRYRLHLVKFNTRFNSSNGNFEIDTTFVGSTYAYLNDIPLDGVMEAAYMYPIEITKDSKFNEKTKTYDKVVKKTSRGYSILKSVYSEYRNKGLLPKTFPDRTLREVIAIARRLESILEEEIFSKTVDPRVLNDVTQFDRTLRDFEKSIKNWKTKFLSAEFFTDKPDEKIEWNIHLDKTGKPASTLELLTGETAGSLFLIIKNYCSAIDSNQAFGKSRDVKLLKDGNIARQIRTISASALLNIKNYYKVGAKIGVNINDLLNVLYSVQKEYVEERAKLERIIEEKMNDIIKRKDIGIGFEPTIRNIVGLILANADTYIRLLKDVHYRAFQVAEERKNILNAVSTDSIGESIYPWPEVKKPATGKKQNVLVYPGAYDMARTLQSYDTRLWPEVDFVENYVAVATKKIEPGDDKETGPELINFLTDNNTDKNKIKEIGLLLSLTDSIPYGDKSISSILYEIFERARYITSVDSFKTEAIRELALLEFDNLRSQIAEDFDIIEMLKTHITDVTNLKKYMLGFSAYERYPYYEDQQPTVPYIKESLQQTFKIEQYKPKNNVVDNKALYTNLGKNLFEYVGEEYRTKIYPFNSDEYISYINFYGYSGYTANQIHMKGMVRLDTIESLASSAIEPNMWHYADDAKYDVNTGTTVQKKVGKNLFENSLIFETLNFTGGTSTIKEFRYIINTPYFHKQLYKDFRDPKTRGRYAGSAYLLLSQLNFKQLSHQIADSLNVALTYQFAKGTTPGILMSTLFRELAATHYVPYHLILQWGAIYHRYKKYLLEGEDILSGMTQPIDMNLFFDNNQDLTYNFSLSGQSGSRNYSITRNNEKSYGFTPFYHSIYHQIINDYTFYDPLSAAPNTSYVNAINQGVIKLFPTRGLGSASWNILIDNSKFDSTKKTLTILPCGGLMEYNYSGYTRQQQDNFKTVWGDYNKLTSPVQNPNLKNYAPLYSGVTFPSYKQYLTDKYGGPNISSSNKKIIDLIATFSPELLDQFEEMFLDFSSDTINDGVNQNKFNFKYNTFKSMLKELSTIQFTSEDKFTLQEDLDNFSLNINWRQREKLFIMTESILSNDNLVKLTITNPKEIDAHVLGGFAQVNVERFSSGIDFDNGQITQDTQNAIELYLGEDISGYYVDFFRFNNVELNEENIRKFRFLIHIYGGYRKSGGVNSKQAFIEYLRNNIILKDSDKISKVSGQENRLKLFLDTLISRFSTLKVNAGTQRLKIDRGYNDDPIKLEMYNFFKSFNDKWVAGNSIGQRGLLEEFLFLDKANVDIGNNVFIDIKKLIEIGDQRNSKKQNLYGTIANLIARTGFDLRPLPAYINFYGTNFNNKVKTTPSKTVASNIFGSFLEVDYQESAPKIILQYTGPTSKYLELNEINKKFLYKDDSFNISQTTNNPILVANDFFNTVDFFKSNKAVAFEVSFGDQNQGIFKSIELDQSSIKNTSESFAVLERLGNSETGSSTAQVDIGLFDIYRSQSYACTVSMMGDVMIQPTMYFYLKNVPLFKGTYLITEVNHTIRNNTIETSFKGGRIPITSLPDPKDSFMASYRALFDKMVAKATAKVKEADKKLANVKNGDKVYTDNKGNTYVYNTGGKEISGEKILEKASITNYGVPYGGYEDQKSIQMVQYEDGEWLRGVVTTLGGTKYNPADDVELGIVSRYVHLSGSTTVQVNEKIKWSEVKATSDKQSFYSTQFNLGGSLTANDLVSKFGSTEFYNPKPNVKKKVTVKTSFDYTNKKFNGPIHLGISPDYGIALSKSLMTQLDLYEGDVVYFRLSS